MQRLQGFFWFISTVTDRKNYLFVSYRTYYFQLQNDRLITSDTVRWPYRTQKVNRTYSYLNKRLLYKKQAQLAKSNPKTSGQVTVALN